MASVSIAAPGHWWQLSPSSEKVTTCHHMVGRAPATSAVPGGGWGGGGVDLGDDTTSKSVGEYRQ